MDKRVQVFVSSTYLDLITERQRVNQTLLQLECFPAGMELFPASDEDKWDLIKGVIDDSDYYLLILGGRYGSLDDTTDLSYTQMEYQYAIDEKKPVMAFLHRNLDKIESGKTEKDPDKAAKLKEFRESVSAKRTVQFYETADELAALVATSLVALQKKFPAVGWIRGDQAMTPEVRAQLAELRAALAEAERAPKTGPMMEHLAEGEEIYRYGFRLRYRTTSSKTENIVRDVEVTWDNILGFVGPSLLHEVQEFRFKEKVDDELGRYAIYNFPDLPSDYKSTVQTLLVRDNFDEIKVQFFALGLIERGTLKRTVSDRNPYWKLTQRGEDRLMSLRAIRKPGYEIL